MNRTIHVMLVAGLFGCVMTVLLAQRPAVQSYPADRLTPQTIVVGATLPDAALVCAEASDPSGLVACRTAQEFRAWVRARKEAK